jgi:hypothetical protein
MALQDAISVDMQYDAVIWVPSREEYEDAPDQLARALETTPAGKELDNFQGVTVLDDYEVNRVYWAAENDDNGAGLTKCAICNNSMPAASTICSNICCPKSDSKYNKDTKRFM